MEIGSLDYLDNFVLIFTTQAPIPPHPYGGFPLRDTARVAPLRPFPIGEQSEVAVQFRVR